MCLCPFPSPALHGDLFLSLQLEIKGREGGREGPTDEWMNNNEEEKEEKQLVFFQHALWPDPSLSILYALTHVIFTTA